MTRTRSAAFVLLTALLVLGMCAVSTDGSDAAEGKYKVIVQDGSHEYGQISLSGGPEFSEGDTVEFSVSGNLKTVTCKTAKGQKVPLDHTGSDYSFVMPADNVRIVASFAPHLNKVSIVVDGTGGTAVLERDGVETGGTVRVIATPDPGMKMDVLNIFFDDGTGQFAEEGDSFVHTYGGDITVHVNFIKADYTITVDPDVKGGKLIVLQIMASYGEEVTVVTMPDRGLRLTHLWYTDDEGGSTDISGDSFSMPACDVTVHATFGPSLTSVPASDPPEKWEPSLVVGAALLMLLSLSLMAFRRF